MAAVAVKRNKVKEYLSKPYARELIRNEDGTWYARVVELKGCMTEGDTEEEALEALGDAMKAWLEVAIEDKEPIPEPLESRAYSGKFVVRVPRTMHRDLTKRAEIEGVSLNQFVLTALAKEVRGTRG
jgi:antitoxin HicB